MQVLNPILIGLHEGSVELRPYVGVLRCFSFSLARLKILIPLPLPLPLLPFYSLLVHS